MSLFWFDLFPRLDPSTWPPMVWWEYRAPRRRRKNLLYRRVSP